MRSLHDTTLLALVAAELFVSFPIGAQDRPGPEARKGLERVATGFQFVEGPAWDPVEQHLLFSDIRANRIHKLGAKDKVTVFFDPSNRANGLVFDRQGDLYACLGGARQVVRIDSAGERTVLAQEFEGKKLNSPNDLALDDEGGLYFTDPRYGNAADLEQEVMGVYYVSDTGAITRVIDELKRPNGIVMTRDGSGLYVAEPDAREIHYYPVLGPGRLGKGRVIFRSDAAVDAGGPDGMTLDEHGNLYATYKNLLVLDPRGKLLRRIPVPEKPSNVTFGGPENKTLFVTARTSLYRMKLDVRGAGDFVVAPLIGRRMTREPRFAMQTLDDKIGIGYGLSVIDVNGDGRKDVVLVDKATVSWYENPVGGRTWSKHIIAEKLTTHDHVCVAAADIDGDGKAEIAVGAGWNPRDTVGSGSIHYLVPPGDRTKPWKPVALRHEPTVHRMAFVRNAGGGFDLVVLPLHGKGRPTTGVRILLYRTPKDLSEAGTAGDWETTLIDDSLHRTHNLDPVQWDGDPEDELLVASTEGVFLFDRADGKWQRSMIAGAPGSTRVGEGDPTFRGASEVRLGTHERAQGSRFIATVEPFHGNQLAVYTAPVAGTPRTHWRRQVVAADFAQAHALACADLLGDGRALVVVGWRNKNANGEIGIRMYEPHDARFRLANMTTIDSTIACEDLRVADLDGDGHLDIIAAGRATHDLKVYYNRTFAK